jgi:hypothetical protein
MMMTSTGSSSMATPQEKAAALKKAKAEFVEVCGRACTLRDVCVPQRGSRMPSRSSPCWQASSQRDDALNLVCIAFVCMLLGTSTAAAAEYGQEARPGHALCREAGKCAHHSQPGRSPAAANAAHPGVHGMCDHRAAAHHHRENSH